MYRFRWAVLAMFVGTGLYSADADAGRRGKKKKTTETVPLTGWQTQEEWRGDCWYPPNYAELSTVERAIPNKHRHSLKLSAIITRHIHPRRFAFK